MPESSKGNVRQLRPSVSCPVVNHSARLGSVSQSRNHNFLSVSTLLVEVMTLVITSFLYPFVVFISSHFISFHLHLFISNAKLQWVCSLITLDLLARYPWCYTFLESLFYFEFNQIKKKYLFCNAWRHKAVVENRQNPEENTTFLTLFWIIKHVCLDISTCNCIFS